MRACIAMDGRYFLHPSTATFCPVAAIHFLNRNTHQHIKNHDGSRKNPEIVNPHSGSAGELVASSQSQFSMCTDATVLPGYGMLGGHEQLAWCQWSVCTPSSVSLSHLGAAQPADVALLVLQCTGTTHCNVEVQPINH
jgi:hypothetical protein